MSRARLHAPLRNVRLLVAYDGSRFHGWQRQAGFATVQQTLEEAFLALTGAPTTVYGAGRTDAGVHALGQVAHAHVATRIDDRRLRAALQAHAGQGVAVRSVETCPDEFHAQFHARGKRYAYLIQRGSARLPFAERHSHWVREELDLASMRLAARALLGRRDFSAFACAGSPRRSGVRTLRSLRLVARRGWLAFVLQGDGFLYNMARTLVGTLLEVGRGKLAPESLAAILESRDRRLAGPTAPPEGLYLVRVLYPDAAGIRQSQSGSGDGR
jgi:tRNA pseudouridine38-40 synthase